MKNIFHNRNFIITAILVAVVAAVLIVSLVLRPAPSVPEGARQIDLTATAEPAAETAAPADTTPEPAAETVAPADTTPEPAAETVAPADTTPEPAAETSGQAEEADGETETPKYTIKRAAAYVLCELPALGQYGFIPLPEEGEVSYPIHQAFTDGTTFTNIVRLTPEGFCMESSTCENQDCVGEGFVSLENREERILQNAVICLPNQVMLELYTAEELEAMGITLIDPYEGAEPVSPEAGQPEDAAGTQQVASEEISAEDPSAESQPGSEG